MKNLLAEGLELLIGGGAKMAEKCKSHTLFCQISSNRNTKFALTGG